MSEAIDLQAHDRSRHPGWTEVAAIILIAAAAILTAWAAFESAKWSGVQATESRRASAAGTAASRETTIASTQRSIDVATFLQWLQAVRDDIQAGLVVLSPGSYVPDGSTLSGFIALRFRAEFKPAFAKWITTSPLTNVNAPTTPFELPEYSLTADAEIEQSESDAQASLAKAETANNRGEDYVLLTVLFAVALVLASIASKLSHPVASALLLGLAFFTVLATASVMATYPIRL